MCASVWKEKILLDNKEMPKYILGVNVQTETHNLNKFYVFACINYIKVDVNRL